MSSRFIALRGVSQLFFSFSRVSMRCLRFHKCFCFFLVCPGASFATGNGCRSFSDPSFAFDVEYNGTYEKQKLNKAFRAFLGVSLGCLTLLAFLSLTFFVRVWVRCFTFLSVVAVVVPGVSSTIGAVYFCSFTCFRPQSRSLITLTERNSSPWRGMRSALRRGGARVGLGRARHRHETGFTGPGVSVPCHRTRGGRQRPSACLHRQAWVVRALPADDTSVVGNWSSYR